MVKLKHFFDGIPPGKLLSGLITFNITAVAVAVILGIYDGNLLEHFKEKHLITWISVVQLLAVSYVVYGIYNVRSITKRPVNWHDSYMIWAIISFGFLFLAADELTMIHESIDNGIHYIFRLNETGLTDRIDDLLIGIYGIVGLIVLHKYREEIRRCRPLIPYLAAGFIMLFVTVILDVITNRNDILGMILPQRLVLSTHDIIAIIEDSLKIFAESVFLTGFYNTRKRYKSFEKEQVSYSGLKLLLEKQH